MFLYLDYYDWFCGLVVCVFVWVFTVCDLFLIRLLFVLRSDWFDVLGLISSLMGWLG